MVPSDYTVQCPYITVYHKQICGVCPNMWDYQSWWHFTPHVNYSLTLLKSEDFHSTLLALQNIYSPNLNCRRVSPKHREHMDFEKWTHQEGSLGNHHFQVFDLKWLRFILHSRMAIQNPTSCHFNSTTPKTSPQTHRFAKAESWLKYPPEFGCPEVDAHWKPRNSRHVNYPIEHQSLICLDNWN